jgi:hypothetical protein
VGLCVRTQEQHKQEQYNQEQHDKMAPQQTLAPPTCNRFTDLSLMCNFITQEQHDTMATQQNGVTKTLALPTCNRFTDLSLMCSFISATTSLPIRLMLRFKT